MRKQAIAFVVLAAPFSAHAAPTVNLFCGTLPNGGHIPCVASSIMAQSVQAVVGMIDGSGASQMVPDFQSGPAAGFDQFTGPDAIVFGGAALPDKPAGSGSSAPAFNPSVDIMAAPYGAFNTGCALCLFMSGDVASSNRAGISGVDYRLGAGVMPSIGSNDVVGLYEQPQNYPARFVLPAASYTASAVYLATPLTAEQISLLRPGMYIVTNSIDPTSPTGTGADGLPVNDLMEGFVSGWDPNGRFVNVVAWASVSGNGRGGVPSTSAIDNAYSHYAGPMVFIGAPTKVFGRNMFMSYNASAGEGANVTSLVHRFEGEEMDFRYNAASANSLYFHGVTVSVQPSGGIGPVALTGYSYDMLLAGSIPVSLQIQNGPSGTDILSGGFVANDNQGETSVIPVGISFEHDSYADGVNDLRLMGRVTHTGTATGWPGAQYDLGLYIDGAPNTVSGTYAGGLRFNAGGTQQASVSLCGQQGCGIEVQANGLTKTGSVKFSTLPACSSSLASTIADVSDSTTATFNATVTGGGTNDMAVRCNGTSWVVY